MRRRQASSGRVQPHYIRQMRPGLGVGGGVGRVLREDTGTTPSSLPHQLPSYCIAKPVTDQTAVGWGVAGSRNWDGRDTRPSSVPASARSPLLSCTRPPSVCCVLLLLSLFLPPFPSSLQPFPDSPHYPHSPLHVPPLLLSPRRFTGGSQTRPARVKPGAVLGRKGGGVAGEGAR